jgi:hypothetical protein
VDLEIIDEIRVASAAETLLAVAKDLGVLDLVIIGDSALHQGACTIDRLVEIDWQRIGFTSPQLLYEGGSIIAGLDRLLGRSWDPSRLARWLALLDESVLRPAGRAQATRRWKRGH